MDVERRAVGDVRRSGERSTRRTPGSTPAVTPLSILGAGTVDLWLRSDLGVTLGTPPAVAAWADQSGQGNDATQLIEALRPDRAAGVIDFTAASLETLSIADDASLHYTTAMTLAMRVRPDSLAGSPAWLTKSATGAGDWSVQYAGELRLWFGTPGVAGGAAPAGSFTAAAWHTVIIAYDGGGAANADRLKMWVNGVAQTLTFYGTIPATITPGNSPVTIASWSNGLAYLDGAYREIVIAHVVPTAQQITDLTTLLTV